MKTLICRLIGVRIVESPEALRATFPRYLVRFGVFDKVVAKLRKNATDGATVRVVGRSIIIKLVAR